VRDASDCAGMVAAGSQAPTVEGSSDPDGPVSGVLGVRGGRARSVSCGAPIASSHRQPMMCLLPTSALSILVIDRRVHSSCPRCMPPKIRVPSA